MAKNPPQFKCSKCNTSYLKWTGKCEVCNNWNTISETKETFEIIESNNYGMKKGKIIPFKNFSKIEKETDRMRSKISEFDRVMGGGIVSGSATIISGDPGIGKSTLLLQIASKVSKNNLKIIYISGEESESQISLRAERLGCLNDNVLISSSNNLRSIITDLSIQCLLTKEDKLVLLEGQTVESLIDMFKKTDWLNFHQ